MKFQFGELRKSEFMNVFNGGEDNYELSKL